MNIKKDELSIAVLLPVAVGTVAAYLTRNAQVSFSMMNQPPLSPPAWLFPVVWTILYVLMGIASYIIWRSDNKDARNALQVYLIQLGFNFCWPIIFFNFKCYLFAFFWLVVLWVLILITIIKFYRIDKIAAYLMIPYILWVSFAGYLNIGVYFLN